MSKDPLEMYLVAKGTNADSETGTKREPLEFFQFYEFIQHEIEKTIHMFRDCGEELKDDMNEYAIVHHNRPPAKRGRMKSVPKLQKVDNHFKNSFQEASSPFACFGPGRNNY